MYDMSDTATYIPGRHQPFDLSNIEWTNSLPTVSKTRKTYEGQLRLFLDHVVKMNRPEWARYPFTYKTIGGARAAAINAKKAYGTMPLVFEARGTSLFAKVA